MPLDGIQYEVGSTPFDQIFVTPKEAEEAFSNKLYMWGLNANGQLGIGMWANINVSIPTIVSSQNFFKIVCGTFDSFAIDDRYNDGALKRGWIYAAGKGLNGILGHNDITDRPYFNLTSGNLEYKEVASWNYTALAIRDNNTLWEWGKSSINGVQKSTPTQIGTANDWLKVDVGGTDFAVAIKQDNSLWTWGNNSSGQLGNNTLINVISPTQVGGVGNWKQISTGDQNVSAVKLDGTLWSWGENSLGQSGVNNVINHSSPVQVGTGTDWKQVSCSKGGYFITAIKNDGTLWTWGYGATGQLGINVGTLSKSSPVQTIAGGTNWSEVSAGVAHVLALKTDGSLWAWGSNSAGAMCIGDGTSIDRSSPVQIGAGIHWSSISAGNAISGAIRSLI